MDRLNDMRLFLDAASLGSFSAAGRKHGLSPAASSACIQRLEATLKIRLFERTTRQLRLTDEGQIYRAYSQQVLDLLIEAEHALQAGRTEVQGVVRISAPSDLGRNVLLTALDEFSLQYPEVRFALSLTDSTANLVGDDIDLAVRYGQPADSSMVARQLLPSQRVVCASPARVALTGAPQTPADLQRLPALVLVTGAGPMNEWRYRDQGQSASVRVEGVRHSNDGEVIRKWALQGYGYAWKSLPDITADLAAGRLVTVLEDYFVDHAPLNVLYHANRLQPLRLKLLIEFLMARFAGQTA